MKILKFKGKMPFKNKLLITLAIIFTIAGISIVITYNVNEQVKEWIDVNILKKEITEEDVATIELEVDKTQYVIAYDKYISILCNGKLSIYNSYGSKEAELDIGISNPMYATNNNYLVIAEKNGQRIYLISEEKIIWDSRLEGTISKVNVSKSGSVSAVTTETIYKKGVVVIFDKNGHELFKTYLGSTNAVDTDISVDGKYLAIAGINTSGALVKSTIQIYDIEKATEKATSGGANEALIYIHNADSSQIITNIKYQEKGQLVCIYDDSVHMIYQDEDTTLIEFNKDTQIADINLKSYVARAEEISTGLFSSKTDIILKNIITGVETTYTVNSPIKELISYNEITAINIGAEIHFINLNGNLQKRYTSKQEAKEVVIGTSVAGIVYRDRIKVFTF